MYIIVSIQYRNQFSKDSLSTDPQFTHISALKAETNTLSQLPSVNNDDVAKHHIASVYNNGQQNELYKRLK